MKRIHRTPEQIVRNLQEAHRVFGEDRPMVESVSILRLRSSCITGAGIDTEFENC